MGMKKDSAIHRWEQLQKEYRQKKIKMLIKKRKDKIMDSILEEVLKVDCSKDDAIAIISTELDKRDIHNVDWEDEILQNWEDAQ